jgi:hypothetical protein
LFYLLGEFFDHRSAAGGGGTTIIVALAPGAATASGMRNASLRFFG